MDAAQLTLLKRHLSDVYAGNLPPLLLPSPDAAQNDQKNLARSLSAFFVRHHCGASAADACVSVVDDFGDLGVDAIYSLRITQSRRCTAFRDGDYMRFLTIAPDHDSTYGRK